MLKYYNTAVTFAEFPREIALCINITQCPNHCDECSEPWLREDCGSELTKEVLVDLVQQYPDVTLIGFMGGDNDHDEVHNLTNFIHDTLHLKVGMYSGQDSIDLSLATILDYYKIGRWIPFKGEQSTWHNQSAGPLCLPTTNQKMYMRVGNKLIDVTNDFRKYKISDWSTVII